MNSYHFKKRIFDLTLSVPALFVLSPVLLVIAISVRIFIGRQVLFSQIRPGLKGRLFTLHKFRTMTVDAEKNGVQWATKDDPRVTPFGFFLRKTRLDEILQFWNILKGDMAFVGPRPERPELVEQIEKEVPFFSYRHWARPGLTGLAQIRYRYGDNVKDAKEKLRYDLYYIKNWSILLDIQIILRTFSAIMKGSQ